MFEIILKKIVLLVNIVASSISSSGKNLYRWEFQFITSPLMLAC